MSDPQPIRTDGATVAPAGLIRLAVLAVGGQGGGVLTGWIEALARGNGYRAQATSVAGVAQRTGATVYYVEMAPETGALPVFSLMPAAGDVDVMIAAELMEAGRAIIRGFVTPDRTTLIASTHRALAVSEKMVPGDGIASAEEVIAAARVAARRLVLADYHAIAVAQGSVISASLFGALAGSGALPFPVEAFEAAIREGGTGVERSLRAFRAALVPPEEGTSTPPTHAEPRLSGPPRLVAAWDGLAARAAALPAPVVAMALAGLRKVVAFQDLAYGAEYLDRLDGVLIQDDEAHGWALTHEAAKHVANAMAYDDILRVADAKTRAPRLPRIDAEMGRGEAQVLHLTEFFHPRAEELVSLFPARLGARVAGSPGAMRWIARIAGGGRRMRTDRLGPFLTLHAVAGLRRWRRGMLRHQGERAHLDAWLARSLSHLPDYALAVEAVRMRRLIKGYSDTHARGLAKFDRVMDALDLLRGREDAPQWAARLRESALRDEAGTALADAIRTVESFADGRP